MHFRLLKFESSNGQRSPLMSDPHNIFYLRQIQQPSIKSQEPQRSKPKEPPKTDKNFKKMVNPASPEHTRETEEANVEEQSEGKTSLFDLSAKKDSSTKKKTLGSTKDSKEPKISDALKGAPPSGEDAAYLSENQSKDQLPYEAGEETGLSSSPEEEILSEGELQENRISLINKEGIIKGQIAAIHQRAARFDSSSLDDTTVVGSKEPKSKSQSSSSRERTDFVQEKGDLAALNPSITSLNAADDSIGNQEQTTGSRAIQEVIDQVVKHIQSIQSQGKTDTIVTLQHPPILQGANLVLTAFEHAQKEFNIAFTNLTSAAKQFLDQQLSKKSLQAALESQGYVVHMLVTSTASEATPDQQFGRQSREDQQQQQQGRGDQQEKDKED